MNNDPVNKSNEEEYQFSDSENSTEFAPPSAKRPSMPIKEGGKSGQKKIFVIIGIIIAIFCLYKLYGVFSATPEKPKNEMPIPAAPVVETKAPPIVVAPKPIEPAVPEEITSMQDKVGTLEKVVSQVSQSNANLQDQMAGVSTAIADIQNNISLLTQQVSDLTKPKEKPAEVKKPEGMKASTTKSRANVKTRTKTKVAAVMKNSNYYIRAMIQGRAWLMTSAGDTLTVSEGDNLPGYGLIGSIDPGKGEITTSSGAVITYKSDDR